MESPDEVTPTNILADADQITSVDRQRYYGHPLDNHGNTAALWTAWLKRRFPELAGEWQLDARDVCWLMILLKASREANLRNRDNLVDACGYARNAEMVEQEAERRRTAPPADENHGET